MNTRVDRKADTRGVYKLRHAGVIYYRLSRSLKYAVETLAQELKASVEYIEVLDGGKKQ